jgi:hypothetical protein
MVLRHPPETDTHRLRQRVTGIGFGDFLFCPAKTQCSAWQSPNNNYLP